MLNSTAASHAPHDTFKSKTLAAALALLLGALGAHRFYLHGWRDWAGWAHLAGTLAGLAGVLMLRSQSHGTALGWVAAVMGAVSLLAAFLTAIVIGLRPDEKWDARFNPDDTRKNHSGWTAVFIVIFALFFGAMLLMGGLAYSFQSYFEAQPGISTSLE